MDTTESIQHPCPTCKVNINAASWITHTAVCARRNHFCTGCEKIIQIINLDAHNKQFHALINCECGQQIETSKLQLHVENACPKRFITCNFCKCGEYADQIKKHEIDCGNRTDVCEHCTKRMTLHALKLHDCRDNKKARQVTDNTCPFCDGHFPSDPDLQEHMFSEHTELFI